MKLMKLMIPMDVDDEDDDNDYGEDDTNNGDDMMIVIIKLIHTKSCGKDSTRSLKVRPIEALYEL